MISHAIKPPASIATRSLVCGFPQSLRSNRILVMLKVFFDGSGTLNQTAHFILAGYISTVEQWEKFSDDWQRALKGPPKIDYFKVRESIYCDNQFDGWNHAHAKARARKFRRLITRYALGGFAVCIPHDAYIRTVRGRIPKEMDHPYLFAFLSSVELVCKIVGSMGFAGPIDFVFDTESLDSRARALLVDFKRWPWEHSGMVGELDFREDHKVFPLQSADMIAWLIRTHISEGATQLQEQMSINVKPPMFLLTRTEEWLSRYMDDFHERLMEMDRTGELRARYSREP